MNVAASLQVDPLLNINTSQLKPYLSIFSDTILPKSNKHASLLPLMS